MLWARCRMEPLSKKSPGWAVVRCACVVPTKVTTFADGALPLVCWSRKPIHIGESGLISPAYGRLAWFATLRGIPSCMNSIRVLVYLKGTLNVGEATELP